MLAPNMPKIRMMDLFDNVQERIRTFVEENSKLTATVIGLFILLVVGGLFALVFGGGRKPSLQKTSSNGKNSSLPSRHP